MADTTAPALDTRRGSLDRGLHILDYLAVAREASTAEIVAAAGISRSAAYRLVERLQDLDYLTTNDLGRWRLGPAAARLAMAAIETTDVSDAAPELLRSLVQQVRETAGLGVLSHDEIVFVYRELGPQSVQVRAELGARRPLHATSIGKAYLSGLDPVSLSQTLKQLELTKFTDTTITNRTELREEIDRTRLRGWSEEHGEFDAACTCLGAPVFDHAGKVTAAISVAGLAGRLNGREGSIGPVVAATAAAISRRLGHIPDTQPN